MLITYHIRLFLHKRSAAATGSLVIRMRVTVRGCRPLDFPTGVSAAPAEWDADLQRIVRTAPDAALRNRTLQDICSRVDEVFARYELIEKRIPSPSELKTAVNDALGRNKTAPQVTGDSFYDTFDYFLSSREVQHQWNDTTRERYMVLKRKLLKFDPHLKFEDLTEQKMTDFVFFLENTYHLNNTTLSKVLGNFRWFIKWAAEKGYYTGHVHQSFRPRLKGSDGSLKQVIYLTLEEVRMLEQYTFSERQKHLEQVRDVLLFCCFTGLRYSDAQKLKKNDITNGIIHVVTKKTNDGLAIELNKHSRAILDKYGRANLKNNAALPVISNQKMNDYLKELGQLCGIDSPVRIVHFEGNERKEEVYPKWQLLTSHVGRRTFVVTALQLGIPAEVIMKWTGHKDYHAMKPYIAIVDNLKKQQMSLFNAL